MAFKPWFRRILVNLCINHFKKHQKKALENSVDTISESTDSYPNALENMQYEELLMLILQLPPAYRAVFNLYILDGFSHEEIAGMLEISIGTSKSNLSRAREKLKEMLNPKSYEREPLRQKR